MGGQNGFHVQAGEKLTTSYFQYEGGKLIASVQAMGEAGKDCKQS